MFLASMLIQRWGTDEFTAPKHEAFGPSQDELEAERGFHSYGLDRMERLRLERQRRHRSSERHARHGRGGSASGGTGGGFLGGGLFGMSDYFGGGFFGSFCAAMLLSLFLFAVGLFLLRARPALRQHWLDVAARIEVWMLNLLGQENHRGTRERVSSEEVQKIQRETFVDEQQLQSLGIHELKWSVASLKDELRKLHRQAELRMTFAGGRETREMQQFLKSGLGVEKAELVQAVLKARGGDSGINCAVCLSNYTSGDELRVLPCGHRFHCDCERQPASRMVTHNWDNIFSHLVAAILADAFDVPSYGPFLMHLDEKLPALRDELAKRGQLDVSYWICAFTVNQHSSICGGFGPAPQGDDFAAWDRKRYDSVTGEAYPLCGCATPKFFNKDWDLTELNKFDPMMECMSLRYSDMRQVIAVDERLDLFTRAWCIAEMHMAHKLQILQRVKLYDLDMLVDTPHFEHLDIQKCKASRKEDEDEILSKIEDKARFNHEVKTLLSDPVDGILVSPLWHKSRELAMRSIELSDMLNFFGSLSTMMPHYDARLSTTSDVVRGAIIPNSVAFPRYRRSLERSTAHNSCTPRWPAFAFSTVLKPWGAAPACCFVSQNWQMPFATVLARITANALQRSTFGGVLESLCEGGSVEVLVEVAKHEVGSCAYWLDAFCINQHTSICGGNPAGDRDSVTGQWNRDSLEATLHRLPYGVEHFNERGIIYDKWPFRLDIDTEYQDWILVAACFVVLCIWCLPCICGRLTSRTGRAFSSLVYTRLHMFFLVATYFNVFIILFTLGILPDWTVNEFVVLVHTEKLIMSFSILFCFFLIWRLRHKIALATGLEHITLIRFSWRDLCGFGVRQRPIEVFIWKVQGLQSASSKITKPNDLFVECHMGFLDRLKNDVKSDARPRNRAARVTLSTREICGIEDQTGKRRSTFSYDQESFVELTLMPLAVAPVDEANGDDETKLLLQNEDSLLPC
eukprot:g32145.t1